jgi:hypothetical protein
MAEISELLNDLSKQFSIKINEINELYEKKLEEQKMNISYNLDSGYTKDYGIFNLDVDNKEKYEPNRQMMYYINNYLKQIDNSRYVIHYIGFIIDNYGDYCININNAKFIGNELYYDNRKKLDISKYIKFKSKYMLPDILIKYIKNICIYPMNSESIQLILNSIQLVSEDYYKRFKQNNNYNEINELNKQYILQIEQLTEENTKIKLELQKQNETKLKSASSYDDILFQQIKDLQNQLEICKKEKEEINKKFNDMKLLLGIN